MSTRQSAAMTQPDRELIGRDAERREIEGWIGADHRSSGALLLTGEAGIGKTTLWRDAAAAPRRPRRPGLSASPARARPPPQFPALCAPPRHPLPGSAPLRPP